MRNRMIRTEIGGGQAEMNGESWRLTVPAAGSDRYVDAQISDYDPAQMNFRLNPPLRISLMARFFPAEGLRGTAGFGLWNHPFSPDQRGFKFPAAAWFFFSSPPSNMQLADGVPGPGWKAATIDARRWPFFALLPAAPPGVLLMRFPALYRLLWPIGQRAVGVSEHLLDSALLNAEHHYTLEWYADRLRFAIDGVGLHQTPFSPRGPLGFIAWVDNQYAIVTPQGRFGAGVVPLPREQSLLLHSIKIEENIPRQ